MLLDGHQAREKLLPALQARLVALNRSLVLAIVQIGERPDSLLYIEKKQKWAERVGCQTRLIKLPAEVKTAEVIDEIRQLNHSAEVDGLIVQLPLPPGLDEVQVIEAIDPAKDADGLTGHSFKKLTLNRSGALAPATARGVFELLDHYRIESAGRQIVVVGRSALVGQPIALVALNRNATVSVGHRQTADLPVLTRSADILISATGMVGLITADHVRPGQTVIDVGISVVSTSVGGRQIRGDVDRPAVEPVVANLSPVPGGVGPMTVYALFANLVDLCEDK